MVNNTHENQKLIIGGDFNDTDRTVLVMKGHCEDFPSLQSDHEEADTRLLLHAKYASQEHNGIIVQSPDTDVAVLCATHYNALGCRELWFRTGIKDRIRYIPVHSLVSELGPLLCKALPGFHALTGCDSNSSLAGIGKKKALKILFESQDHQTKLAQFGEELELNASIVEAWEGFICNLYTIESKAGSKIHDVRYWLFCQKGHSNENLPPTLDGLHQHTKRANYQAYIWKKALVAIQNLPSAAEHGWEIKSEVLQPVLLTKEPAPQGLLELTVFPCKKSECWRCDCACRSKDMPCTEACACMATENCQNPRTFTYQSSDEEDSN